MRDDQMTFFKMAMLPQTWSSKIFVPAAERMMCKVKMQDGQEENVRE